MFPLKGKEDSPEQCRYEDSDKLERNPPDPELLVPAETMH